MSTTRNSIEMENHVFLKAKTKEEYLSMVARLILHFRDISKQYISLIITCQIYNQISLFNFRFKKDWRSWSRS